MGLACSPASRFSTMLLSLKVFTIRSDRWPGSISPNFPCLRQGFDPPLSRRTIARHPAQASAVGKRSPAARSIRSWFRPTGGFRHPSFGLFSLRCLTSPSVKAPSFIAPLRPAGSLRPFGPGISAVAALSPPLHRSLRFLRHPLPPPPSPSWNTVALQRRSGAYPVVHCGEADGAAASYSPAGPGATVAEGSNRRSDPHAFLAPACQHLWPVADDGP